MTEDYNYFFNLQRNTFIHILLSCEYYINFNKNSRTKQLKYFKTNFQLIDEHCKTLLNFI